MTARFEAQKKLTRQRPYDFDYTELALPTFKYMQESIQKKLAELMIKQGDNYLHLDALNTLSDLIKISMSDGKITYLETFKYSYYFTRIFSIVEESNLKLIDRLVLWQDRIAQGYEEMSLEEIVSFMKNDSFEYFQKTSNVANFNDAAIVFEQALLNQDNLDTLLIPTHLDLGLNVMYQFLPHNIHLIGVSNRAITADGYVRPSGDFFLHDLRHSSLIFYKFKKYMKFNSVTKVQERALAALSDKAMVNLIRSIRAIEDKTLRMSVMHVSFGLHHEQGLPLLASSFKNRKGGYMLMLSYIIKRVGNQDPKFRNPQKNIKIAYEWLQDFWKGYEQAERDILKKEPISIPIGRLHLDNGN